MDEKENQHKPNNVLPGQVRYDELLSSMTQEEEHSENVSSQKIEGQIDFSQLLFDLDARLKQSEDALSHEQKPSRPPKESREQKLEREEKEKEQVAEFEEQKREQQKASQKVVKSDKQTKQEDEDMSNEFKNEEIIEESQDAKSAFSLPPRGSDGLFEKSIDECAALVYSISRRRARHIQAMRRTPGA